MADTDRTPPMPAVRRQTFAQWVQRALSHAHTTKGWSIPRVAEEAGIGNSTIYRWLHQRNHRSPQPEQVVAFCDAIGLPTIEAFTILWPGKHTKPVEPLSALIPKDLVTIARKLADPNVPQPERYLIQEMVQWLASRPQRPPQPKQTRWAGGTSGH